MARSLDVYCRVTFKEQLLKMLALEAIKQRHASVKYQVGCVWVGYVTGHQLSGNKTANGNFISAPSAMVQKTIEQAADPYLLRRN